MSKVEQKPYVIYLAEIIYKNKDGELKFAKKEVLTKGAITKVVNATIHQINERVELADIEPLKNIYKGVLEKLIA